MNVSLPTQTIGNNIEISECLSCSLQFDVCSDSSDISSALAACWLMNDTAKHLPGRARSVYHFSLLSACQACHTSCTELRFDFCNFVWFLSVTGWTDAGFCAMVLVYKVYVPLSSGSDLSDVVPVSAYCPV